MNTLAFAHMRPQVLLERVGVDVEISRAMRANEIVGHAPVS
jgi:hypothetical protein